jgi:hypothetical protein
MLERYLLFNARSRFSTDRCAWIPMVWKCEGLTKSPPDTMPSKCLLESHLTSHVASYQVVNTVTKRLASILARERDTW